MTNRPGAAIASGRQALNLLRLEGKVEAQGRV